MSSATTSSVARGGRDHSPPPSLVRWK